MDEETEIEVEQENIIEYDDNDDDDDDVEEVILGFVEKPKNINSLLPQLFPSKAGGTPAWMDPVNLPTGKSRICDICGEPMQFLLQVYAPISEKESTFHRTLFVFMCPSMACLLQDQHQQWKRRPECPSRSVKVFRCQLPQINTYYQPEAQKVDKMNISSAVGAALCSWCGTWKGDKICSSCQSARYCSEKHQAKHWRSGHKLACQRISMSCPSSDSRSTNATITSTEKKSGACTTLWPEFEIINKDEVDFDTESSEDDISNSLVVKEQTDETYKTLMADFEGDEDKRSWTSFHTRIAKAPEQVLRSHLRSSMRKHRDKDIIEGHFGHFNDKSILVNISARMESRVQDKPVGENGSQIGVRMSKIELVKVRVKFEILKVKRDTWHASGKKSNGPGNAWATFGLSSGTRSNYSDPGYKTRPG